MASMIEQRYEDMDAARTDDDRWTVFVVPFSHNDIGWAGTPAEVAEHRVRIIDEALALASAGESRFRFSMEAALYLREYLDRRPENIERIRDELHRGRLEWGAAYVQCYEGLQTDEGLLRQFTLGRRLLEDTAGYTPRGYWNVDVVARTLQLPQVLRHSGIEYMVISRNRPGLYWWQGPDGTRLLTLNFWEGSYGRASVFDSQSHHNSPLEAHVDHDDGEQVGLDAVRARLRQLAADWSDTLQRSGLPRGLAVVLAADYTVPDAAVIELVERSASTPSADGEAQFELRIGTVGEYIDWLTERCTLNDLPIEVGEVPNPWVYQQPGHWQIVSQLRRAQTAIVAAEAAWALVGVCAHDWGGHPGVALTAAWEDALYPDHGYGGMHGEGTDSVFHDRVNRAFFAARRLVVEALQRFAAAESPVGHEIVVFNAGGRPVTDWLELPGLALADDQPIRVEDDDGAVLEHQLLAEGPASTRCRVGVLVRDLAGVGVRRLRVRGGAPAGGGGAHDPIRAVGEDVVWDSGDVMARVTTRGLAELRVGGTKLISSERFMAGEVISLASPGVDVGEHEADPTYDWAIVRPFQPYPDGPVRPSGVRVEVIERGPLRFAVQAVSRHEHCLVSQRYMFYPALNRIDLRAEITGWAGQHGRELRWIFPAACQAGAVRYGVPFGHATVGHDELREFADLRPREMLRWLMTGESPATLAISTPITTFDWLDPTATPDGNTYLQLVLLATKRSIHPRGNWYGQEGRHIFTASIHLRAHEPTAIDAAARDCEALWCATADTRHRGSQTLALDRAALIAAVEPENVVVSSVKKHDRDRAVVLRIFESSGRPASVRLRTGFAVADAYEVDGNEFPVERREDLRRTASGEVELSLGPWQIATLALVPEVAP